MRVQAEVRPPLWLLGAVARSTRRTCVLPTATTLNPRTLLWLAKPSHRVTGAGQSICSSEPRQRAAKRRSLHKVRRRKANPQVEHPASPLSRQTVDGRKRVFSNGWFEVPADRDLPAQPTSTRWMHSCACDRGQASAAVSRSFRRAHAQRLIVAIPGKRR